MSDPNAKKLKVLQETIVACRHCDRLVLHCQEVAQRKRRAYLNWDYWGRPVPSFGDPDARVLIIGLAPGAHGSNRTGRMFTGDGSGNFLYRVLYRTGFASQPSALSRDDGLRLKDLYVTAAVRCAPPGNKPTPEEFANCRPYLLQELDLLRKVQVVVTLGKLAHDSYLGVLQDRGLIAKRGLYPFGHGATYGLPAGLPWLIASYHPSQQNTQTGKLTEAMLRKVFEKVRRMVNAPGRRAAASRN